MIGKAAATGRGFHGVINYLVRGKLDKDAARQRGFGGVINYLEQPKPGQQRQERVAWRAVRNLMSDDPRMVTRIMRSTASRSRRCATPVYHLVLSWRQDENPTPEIMQQVADTTLADLNLAEHQAFLLAHHDTAHKHLHIIVNRVHPETGKAWSKSHDYRHIERSVGRQAKELGLIYVPGRHNEPQRFADVAKRPRSPEVRMAERLETTGPLRPRWTVAQIAERRASLAPVFERARSWGELTRALAQEGLVLESKGQGLVLGDATGTMKLSDLGKQVRLPGLEARFGERWQEYARSREQPEPVRQPLPASTEDDGAVPPGKPAPLHERARSSTTRVETVAADASESDEGAIAAPSLSERQPDRPVMDRTEFLARWRQRAAEVERQRVERERRAREAAKARQAPKVSPTQTPTPTKAIPPKAGAPLPPTPSVPPASPTSATPPPRSPEGEARDAAFDAKANADAEADLAFKLHQAGLVTRKQLARSVRAREDAQAAIDKMSGLGETLGREVREALTPKKPAPAKRRERMPPRRNRNRDEPER
jgi:hypothetical protein